MTDGDTSNHPKSTYIKKMLLQHQAVAFEDLQDSKEKYREIAEPGIARGVSDFQKNHIEITNVKN